MKSKSLFTLLIASTAALTSATHLLAEPGASDANPPAHTPFVSVIARDFDTWDSNHDGTLSLEEINHVVLDPSVKGDDAAAAASLKLLSRSKKVKLPPLTKEFFADYDKKALALMLHRRPATNPTDAISATVDTVASASTTQPTARSTRLPADFDLYYTASKERIARGGAVQYPHRFVLDHTRQGPLGDCFFVASVSTMMIHDPARLEKMIEPQADGGYIVKLPSTRPITVPALTDTEIAISSTTAGDGAWLAIMEQAFGKYKSRARHKGDDVEGTEILRTGGDSGPTIEALTGHKFLRFAFGKTIEIRKANEAEVLPKVRKELVAALAEHRLMTAGMSPWLGASHAGVDSSDNSDKITGTPVHIPPNITINHVYAIVSYDPATDVIGFWNPHGQMFTPKGEPGLQNGFATSHGQFKLPLTEAYQFYTSFTFESSGPTTNPDVASN
jgi:hypothetical protein